VLEISKGLAKVYVNKSGSGLPGARVYLYTGSGSYLNWYGTSDSNGITNFIIPSGSYKFRADEGGRQVWSSVVQVIKDIENNININMD
jgi:hypothetical protein